MLYDCFAVPVQPFTDNNRNYRAAIRSVDVIFCYVGLNCVNCLPVPSGNYEDLLKLVLEFSDWVNHFFYRFFVS